MLIKRIGIVVFFFGSFLISCKQETAKKEIENSHERIKIASKKVDKLPYYNTPDFAPSWLPSEDELKKFHKIPDFKFKNQLGNEITNDNLKGYIYIANFFFTTCPSICVKLTNNMRKLQKIYKGDDEIKFISHTVFPSYDTVEVLKKYGEREDVNSEKWYLVTGEREKIYKLARESYFADETYKQTNDKNGFIHTENLILVDKHGHIRGVYKGTLPEEVERIKRHIEILKKE
ncbi:MULTISPECIES: SCO family protein [Aquimarina]|uniref:SCO family protein n=1 Tax=Aquimarina TaxID=290174 RepID=UPI000D68C5EE|nr:MULTISPECIES: SCO family protein [Aquimarina]